MSYGEPSGSTVPPFAPADYDKRRFLDVIGRPAALDPKIAEHLEELDRCRARGAFGALPPLQTEPQAGYPSPNSPRRLVALGYLSERGNKKISRGALLPE